MVSREFCSGYDGKNRVICYGSSANCGRFFLSYVHNALNALLWQIPEGRVGFSSGNGIVDNMRSDPERQIVDINQVGIISNVRTVIDVTKGEFGRIVQIDAVRTRTDFYDHEVISVGSLSLHEYKLETAGLSALGLVRTLQKIQRSAQPVE